jgi:hypothetical protein
MRLDHSPAHGGHGPPAHAHASARAREVHALKAAGQSPSQRTTPVTATPAVEVSLSPEAQATLDAEPTATPEAPLSLDASTPVDDSPALAMLAGV